MLRIPPIQNANDESRWSTVWSLVERGTYRIDESPWIRTVDKIRRDGHFYSSKPPLLPTIVAGGYWLLRHSLGWRLETDTRLITSTLLFSLNVIPVVLFLLFFDRFLRESPCRPAVRWFCLAAAGAATYVTAYAVTFNSHTPAAIVCFFVVFFAWRIANGASNPARFVAIGAFSGLLPSLDFLSAPFCLIVFFWLLRRHPRLTLSAFVPAAAIPIVAFFVCNWLVMESLWPAYAFKHTELYSYPGSFWERPRGIAANTDSTPWYAFNALLGHHGWFSHTPLFLLVAGHLLRRPAEGPRGLHWYHTLVAALFTAVALFYIFNRSRDYGGTCQGFRWLFWMIPLWLVALPSAVDRALRSRATLVVSILLLAISVYSSVGALLNPWGTSWIHAAFRTWKWVNY